jgi:hypothetical protein
MPKTANSGPGETNCFADYDQEKVIMKKLATPKLDVRTSISNLLTVFAVVAASIPVLLGDRLVVIVSDVVMQGSIFLHALSISLQRLLS